MRDRASISDQELSVEQRALLERVRRVRRTARAPDALRRRVLALPHGADLAVRPDAALPRLGDAVPRTPLPPRTIWLSAALGLMFMAVVGTRVLERTPLGSALFSPEPTPAETWSAFESQSGSIADHPLFEATARALPAGAADESARSLLGDRPFSRESRAWQIKRWDNLRKAPSERAVHAFEGEGLCTTLGPGDRVIGGWPWLAEGGVEPTEAPVAVALQEGQAYRLMFRAWATGLLPSRMLMAMGHAKSPHSAAAGVRVPLSTTPEFFAMDFVADFDDPGAGIAFLANGGFGVGQAKVCLSDVTFTRR